MPVEPTEQVAARVELWKARLIDTSKRNRLLFFKTSKRGTLRLLEPGADELFDLVVRRGKPLKFPAEEPQGDLFEDEGSEGGEDYELPVRRSPDQAVADAAPKELWRTLESLRKRSRESLAEQGVVSLYLAFGFLEWAEADASELPVSSPLVLAPVELRHAAAHEPYVLTLFEEDLVLNPTLLHKLRSDRNLELPPLPDDFDKSSLPEYFAAVQAAVSGYPGWLVKRETWLGLFSFLKINMYKDLDSHADRARAHSIVQAIAGDTSRQSAQNDGIQSPLAEQLDATVTPLETFEVVESDSSQQEAVQAAKAGLTFVLQGPPGTGKSQTITNIIAECLAAGKTALFVSEKMAALEVVQKRLTQSGLADFCLEAHSYKANKREVITELARTLRAARPNPPASESELHELSRLKSELNEYAAALHKPRGTLGLSVYDAHGKLAGYLSAPNLLFSLPGILSITDQIIAKADGLLERVVHSHKVLIGYRKSAWQDLIATGYTQELSQDLKAHTSQFAAAVVTAQEFSERLSPLCGVVAAASLQELQRIVDLAAMLRDCPGVPAAWLRSPDLRPLIDAARELSQRFAWREQKRAELLSLYRPELFDMASEGIAERLTAASRAATEYAASPQVTGDLLVQRRAPILEQLHRAVAGLETVPAQARALLAEAGLPIPSTLTGIGESLKIIAAAGADLKPTPRWFEKPAAQPLLQRFRDAQTRYADYTAKRDAVRAVYNEDAFQLDHAALLARFMSEYASQFRVLKGQYHKDIALLRTHRRGLDKLPYAQAVKELQQLRELRQSKDWVDAHEMELREWLGERFAGSDTDWAAAIVAAQAFQALEVLAPGQAIPVPLQQIMIASGERVAALGRRCDSLLLELANLNKTLAWLGGAYAADTTRPQRPMVESGDLPLLHERLDSARQSLQLLCDLRDSTAQAALRPEAAARLDILLNALADAKRVVALELDVDNSAAALRERYGELFSGLNTNWQIVLGALDWTGRLLEWLGELIAPDALVAAAVSPGANRAALTDAVAAAPGVIHGFIDEDEYFQSAFSRPKFGMGAAAEEFGNVAAVIGRWQSELDQLAPWLQFRALETDFAQMGMRPVLDALLAAQPAASEVRPAVYKRFWGLWIDAAISGESSLQHFSGDFHDSLVAKFRTLDQLQMRYAKARLAARLAAQRPKSSWTHNGSPEIRLLEREAEKQRRHKSVRQLFGEIPNLLPALKPCLLMSPLSVAQFLDPTKHSFDVVIFDEASQICPEDAIGAILRGRQLVVVGDSKQLPPTHFFAVGEAEDYDDDDEESQDKGILYDSILEECTGAGFPRKMLRWHYRSRCESLIAFSNKHFYDDQLVTFPGAEFEGGEACVEFVHVPNGIYLRGRQAGGGTNREEAQKVAAMVMEHFRRTPNLSLGVIAFSQTQQTAIEDALRIARQKKPWMESHFVEDKQEAFFVKNLENVQGDERDIIIFSVGYGKDRAGKMLMNFGPLNKLGGERRLNVAVTRAKRRVRLVSSILPSDIDPSRTSATGLLLLQKYMEFAKRGVSALARETSESADAEADSLFEWEVGEALQQAGLTIRRQIGCSGYRIDMAVVDPDHHGRYILGVECDGATYHSSKTARDRDRLRQQVLEGLGWRLERVWSTDWVKDPRRQVQRVLDAVSNVQTTPIAATSPVLETGATSQSAEDAESDELLKHFSELSLYEDEVQTGSDLRFADEKLEAAAELQTSVNPMATSDVAEEHSESSQLSPNLTISEYQPCVLPLQGHDSQFYDLAENRSPQLQILLAHIVSQEGPIHYQVATRRLIGAWRMVRGGSKLVAYTLSIARAAERNGTLTIKGEFFWPAGMFDPPVRSGGRSIEEIALEEIEQAVLMSLRDAFGMRRSDLIVNTARVFGFKSTGVTIASRIELAVASLAESGRIRLQDNLCWPIRK